MPGEHLGTHNTGRPRPHEGVLGKAQSWWEARQMVKALEELVADGVLQKQIGEGGEPRYRLRPDVEVHTDPQGNTVVMRKGRATEYPPSRPGLTRQRRAR